MSVLKIEVDKLLLELKQIEIELNSMIKNDELTNKGIENAKEKIKKVKEQIKLDLVSNEKEVKIFLAENHDDLRKTLSEMLLKFNIKTVSEAGNLIELKNRLKREQWDVLILDIDIFESRFDEGLREIFKDAPGIKMLVTSFYDEEMLVEMALETGAKGFYEKSYGDIDLLAETIRKINNGETVVAEKLIKPGAPRN